MLFDNLNCFSEALVIEHVAKVHLLPGLGKSLSPLFAACSTVPPTGLSKSPEIVTDGGERNPDLDEASMSTYSFNRFSGFLARENDVEVHQKGDEVTV